MTNATYLRPPQASTYLAERWGIRATTKTLAKWRVVSGGPRFRLANRDVLYESASLDEWAAARISARSFGSTAEAKAGEAA
jgi:hypothetical protein